jgi:hypothetical protein
MEDATLATDIAGRAAPQDEGTQLLKVVAVLLPPPGSAVSKSRPARFRAFLLRDCAPNA